MKPENALFHMPVRRWTISLIIIIAMVVAPVHAALGINGTGIPPDLTGEKLQAATWFIRTYGDPRTNNDHPARFIEPMITSGLDQDNLPTNKVTTFAVSGGSVYLFVIYDNFRKGDTLTASWTYLENGREVASIRQEAGGDFGRFMVEFQRPDSGWGRGKQRITVTGGGTTENVDFTIGDALQTTPLPYDLSSGMSMSGSLLQETMVLRSEGQGISQTGLVQQKDMDLQPFQLLNGITDPLGTTLSGIRALLGI
jgi:hypothetical protein